jgi:hypothetical protein
MLKRCTHCTVTLPMAEFSKSRSMCRFCDSLGRALRILEERTRDPVAYAEKRKAIKAQSYQRSKVNDPGFTERGRAASRQWRAENLDRAQERNRLWKDANRDATREYAKQWAADNPARKRASLIARYRGVKQATPAWADFEAMDRFYEQARALSALGEPHHVDHIIPLKGKNVCGLHVQGNLQVLPAVVNLSKNNKHGS